jgi:hypothetical protein
LTIVSFIIAFEALIFTIYNLPPTGKEIILFILLNVAGLAMIFAAWLILKYRIESWINSQTSRYQAIAELLVNLKYVKK